MSVIELGSIGTTWKQRDSHSLASGHLTTALLGKKKRQVKES